MPFNQPGPQRLSQLPGDPNVSVGNLVQWQRRLPLLLGVCQQRGSIPVAARRRFLVKPFAKRLGEAIQRPSRRLNAPNDSDSNGRRV
jgi:hypothetical protein